MRLIGITGSIACGKSTVSRELFRRGYPVIDGDVLARELTGAGGAAMAEIGSVFGDQYIAPDGSLNRRLMGQLVFSDPTARARLDQLMAPYLQNLTMERISQARASGASLCFLDMPLLFEKGYDRYCDAVWCVWLPEETQLERLIARDRFTREEALSRMRAVMSSDQKADLSSVVIDNSGSVENTLRQVNEQLQVEQRRSESAARRRRQPESSPSLPQQQRYREAPSLPPDMDMIERPESSRRKPSDRKAEWPMPRWTKIALICALFVLLSAFTAQMLMGGYLSGRQKKHESEQQAIDDNYPLYYTEAIRKNAAEFHLAPALVAAVIRNESSFRPTVESSVGARGLMQLMPDTAEWIAHKLKVDNYSFEMMKEPEYNIRFGCWYLSYLSSLFNSDPWCVVCAYHAGQGEVSSWLSNPLYSNDRKTLIRSNLPEGPTKQYAGRVTRDYGIYQAKYFDQGASVSPSADNAAAD
ncbi:dephospho-CoA kinase [Clostridiales bacterium FE2011]|nr:dephospho-CoA kinase [Clostridiales bacterium FE2011]QTE75132.1 dephospho-CoA kinase [Clostridiales bacterium FE2010]